MSKDPSSVELQVKDLVDANFRLQQEYLNMQGERDRLLVDARAEQQEYDELGRERDRLAARVEEAKLVSEELDLLASELRAYEHEGIDLPWLQLEHLAKRLR